MDIFENFIRLFSSNPLPNDESSETQKQHQMTLGKYEDDIKALENVYGELTGKKITVELRTLLSVCPRDRRRVDAYKGLMKALEKGKGCTLCITSRKTKQEGG